MVKELVNPGSSGWLPATAAALDAGQRSRALEQRARERVHLGEVGQAAEVGGIAARRELVLRLDDAVGAEARIDLLEPPEALDQERRANHEHHRERDSATTSIDRRRPRPAPALPACRRSAFNVAWMSRRRAWSAGTIAKARPATTATEQRHQQDAQVDRRASAMRGMSAGASAISAAHAGDAPAPCRAPPRRARAACSRSRTGGSAAARSRRART